MRTFRTFFVTLSECQLGYDDDEEEEECGVGVDIVSAMLGQINLVSYVPEHL